MVTPPKGPTPPVGPGVPPATPPVPTGSSSAGLKVERPPGDISPKVKGAGLGGLVGAIVAGLVAALTELQRTSASPLLGMAVLLLPPIGSFIGGYFVKGDGR